MVGLLEALVYWIIMPVTIACLAVLNVYTYYKYGDWIRVAKSKLIVVFARRDGLVKLVPAKRSFGDFIDMGNPGKVLVDPEYVYKVDAKTKNLMMFVYEPVAQNVPLEKTKWDELEKRIRATLSPRRIDELVNYKAMELFAGRRGLGFNPVLLIIVIIVAMVLLAAFMG